MLVGMYYNQIDPAMSLQATLKGVVAEVVGGVGQRAGRDRRQPAARAGRELRRRGVRHQLPQSVRLPAADRGPGAAAERPVRQRAAGAARAAHRHLHRPQPPGAHTALGIAGRVRGLRAAAVASGVILRAADPDQRLAVRHAGAQPDAGRRHDRTGLAGTRRAACDRRLYLRAAVAGFVRARRHVDHRAAG